GLSSVTSSSITSAASWTRATSRRAIAAGQPNTAAAPSSDTSDAPAWPIARGDSRSSSPPAAAGAASPAVIASTAAAGCPARDYLAVRTCSSASAAAALALAAQLVRLVARRLAGRAALGGPRIAGELIGEPADLASGVADRVAQLAHVEAGLA